MWKRNKAELVMKKIILKGNVTITYIEHKHKNTRTSVLIHPQNVDKQYHQNLLNFFLKYEVHFSSYFVLIECVTKFLPFRKEPLAHGKIDVLMYENNI